MNTTFQILLTVTVDKATAEGNEFPDLAEDILARYESRSPLPEYVEGRVEKFTVSVIEGETLTSAGAEFTSTTSGV